MIKVISYFEKKLNDNFSIWDLGSLKLYGGIFGLIIGAYYPEIVFKYLWIFLLIFLILIIRYMYLLFVKTLIDKT